jgi:hypothetical protein
MTEVVRLSWLLHIDRHSISQDYLRNAKARRYALAEECLNAALLDHLNVAGPTADRKLRYLTECVGYTSWDTSVQCHVA